MTTQETAPAEWSFAKRIGFRFVFVYFVLYCFPFPLNMASFAGGALGWWHAGWKHLVIWTGAHVLHLANPIEYVRTGSGDATHDYVTVLLTFTLAVGASLLWSTLDRRRKNHTVLARWLRVYLRYMLAINLLIYGVMKVFDLQFSPPSGLTLVETYGQSSPMHLAWTFMGYSVAYTIFAGALEFLGGFLLLFRRTATLGALVASAVLTNVVMMNFCYDIPVKLFSSHLMLMALVILGPSLKRLVEVLVLHRPGEPEDTRPPQWSGWRKWTRRGLKALFVGSFLFGQIKWGWLQMRSSSSQQGPLDGLYEIEALTRNGVSSPPLYTDGSRWRWMEIGPSYLRIATVGGQRTPFCKLDIDAGKHALSVVPGRAPREWEVPGVSGTLTYAIPEPTHLRLRGELDSVPVKIVARKTSPSEFPLKTRGFHWISEFPYNR